VLVSLGDLLQEDLQPAPADVQILTWFRKRIMGVLKCFALRRMAKNLKASSLQAKQAGKQASKHAQQRVGM
jgi:hypothetical protein